MDESWRVGFAAFCQAGTVSLLLFWLTSRRLDSQDKASGAYLMRSGSIYNWNKKLAKNEIKNKSLWVVYLSFVTFSGGKENEKKIDRLDQTFYSCIIFGFNYTPRRTERNERESGNKYLLLHSLGSRPLFLLKIDQKFKESVLVTRWQRALNHQLHRTYICVDRVMNVW